MKKSDFYLRKISKIGKITIWEVDGEYIRDEMDIEFTNFGQHFRFSYIPKYEFWIDSESSPDDFPFFIDHLLVEWKLMEKGVSYEEAIVKADKKENAERKKSKEAREEASMDYEQKIKKTHRKLLGTVKKDIKVWLVDGFLVRSIFDIDFTEGGHDLVYDFVPNKEVWIDNDIKPKERPFVLLHELFERSLMAKGSKYDPAHIRASKLEWSARHDGDKLERSLDKMSWGIKKKRKIT